MRIFEIPGLSFEVVSSSGVVPHMIYYVELYQPRQSRLSFKTVVAGAVSGLGQALGGWGWGMQKVIGDKIRKEVKGIQIIFLLYRVNLVGFVCV